MAVVVLFPAVSGADYAEPLSSTPTPTKVDQVIVQIGGRFCEYLPQRVEAALYGFHPVQQVEFLNDHGTLLVEYDSERVCRPRNWWLRWKERSVLVSDAGHGWIEGAVHSKDRSGMRAVGGTVLQEG